MRRVDRAKVPVPKSLVGVGSPAAKELERAAKHFNDPDSGAFTFAAYKQPDVVDALQELFWGKCAYCESSFKAVSPTDVEHFRPKARVIECDGHRGYWWLAAKWDNLLASCIDCNRQRYHHAFELPSDPLTKKMRGKYKLGKGDSFPILGKQYARQATDDLDAEDAALIDPTRRDPKLHLVWLEIANLSLVGPRRNGDAVDPYGLHTYQVFGLNRQGLVEERTSLQRNLRAQLAFIVQIMDRALMLQGAEASALLEAAFEQFLDLWKYAEPDKPYSAMVEDMLQRESDSLLARYEKLRPEK